MSDVAEQTPQQTPQEEQAPAPPASVTEKLDDTKLKLYRHQFDFFDKDKDGKINAKELLEILHSLGRNATESSAKALIADVDHDKDGAVDFDEFCKMMEDNKARGVDEDALKKAFDHFRGEHEGINPAGLAKVLEEMGEKMSEEDIQEIFEAADTNNDGVIDFDEYKMLMSGKTMSG